MDYESKKMIIFILAIIAGCAINLVIKSAKRNKLAEEQLEVERNLAMGKPISPKELSLGEAIKAGISTDKLLKQVGEALHYSNGKYTFSDLSKRDMAELIIAFYACERIPADKTTIDGYVDTAINNILATLNKEPHKLLDDHLVVSGTKGVDVIKTIILKLPGYNKSISKTHVKEVLNIV